MKVLFVGSNPASASPDNTAFHPSSKTRLKLDKWLVDLDVERVFVNVADYKTPNNRPLSSREIRSLLPSLAAKIEAYPDAKIVAVGATAEKALRMLRITWYHSIPHPSGMNRKLNDPLVVKSTINALILFIKGYNIDTGV
jgi:uracil-DNA glycosylase